ncbi:hypothetical protein YC2023_075275 [Brassica napus]
MANSYTVLADLRAGRCFNTTEVRLLRFWEAKNIKKREQLMSVEMLLVDEHLTLIQGSVPAAIQLINYSLGMLLCLLGSPNIPSLLSSLKPMRQ